RRRREGRKRMRDPRWVRSATTVGAAVADWHSLCAGCARSTGVTPKGLTVTPGVGSRLGQPGEAGPVGSVVPADAGLQLVDRGRPGVERDVPGASPGQHRG